MASPFGSFEYGVQARSAVKGARDAAARLKGIAPRASQFLSEPAVSKAFHDTMEIVHFDNGKGGLYSTVTSNIESLLETPSTVKELRTKGRKVRFAEGNKATYQLEAVLLDEGIQKKFHLSKVMLARARSLAVEDAVEASKVLQKHIRTFADYQFASVLPGNYGYTWKTARESLKHYASKFPMVSMNTEALFCGDRIFIYSEKKGERWRVSGSERVAWLVRLVHRIVSATSPEEANFYLNKELTLLDICIVVDLNALSPNIKHHAFSHLDLSEGKALIRMSSLPTSLRIKLMTLCQKNLALVDVDDTPCATAVRVSNRHFVTCEHVLQEGSRMSVDGVSTSERYSLADDLIVARVNGLYEPWHLREPKLSEMVLICYKRFGEVECVGPFSICDYSASSLNFSKTEELKPGMSGGAIVAVSDLALLGIHSGVSDYSGLGLRYSVDLSARMWSSDDALSEVDTVHMNTQEPLALMRARGLNSNCRLCAASLNPVVREGELVGNALSVKMGLCVAPRLVKGELLALPAQEVGCHSTDVCGINYFEAPGIDSAVPQAFRKPIHGEHVLLMGKGVHGQPYVTNTDVKVTQTYDSFNFQVSGVDYRNSELLLGCAVLAVKDGAVLGVVISPNVDSEESVTRTTAECTFVSGEIDDDYIRPMNNLAKIFPNLNTASWFSQSCHEMDQLREDTLDEIYEYSKDLLAMSNVRKSLYSKRRRSTKTALEDPKFWDDTVLSRAVQNVDLEGDLLSLQHVWKIVGDRDLIYTKILLILIYFVDKYEQSRKVVEIVEHLALI